MTAAKSKLEDLDRFFEYDLHIPTRTLYMGSATTNWDGGEAGVDNWMAERVIKGLHLLDRAPGTEQGITILMNNPGGDWYHGMAIFDAVRACSRPVTITATGYVMSMGAVIFQAADERVMRPNARLMIHYGYASQNSDAKTFQKWAKEYEKVDAEMESILLARIRDKQADFSEAQLREMLNFDTILNAEESVHLGLADRVADEAA